MMEDLDEFTWLFVPQNFTVERRLTALAYTAAEVAPAAPVHVKDPPSVSTSHATSDLVGDDKVVFHTFNPPALDDPVVRALFTLNVNISRIKRLVPQSRLTPALRVLFSDLASLTIKDPGQTRDIHEEASVSIVRGAMQTLTSLAVCALLQLWIEDNKDTTPEFSDALAYLATLRTQEQQQLPDCKPDHILSTGGEEISRVVATLDRKGNEFAAYKYTNALNLHADYNTKDSFIDFVVKECKSLKTMYDLLKEPRVGETELGEKSWQISVLHLLAQMAVQAKTSQAKLSFFSSVYSLNRVCLFTEGRVFITSNLTKGGRASRNPNDAMPFLQYLFIFLVASIAKAKPEAIPPSKREAYTNLFTPTVSAQTSFHPPPPSVFSVGHTALRSTIPSICRPFLFKYLLSDFSVPFGGGTFSRSNGRGWLCFPSIPFDLLDENNGRRVAVSTTTGLVLKMFSKFEDLLLEEDIYKVIDRSRIRYVPHYFGTFKNEWMRLHALLLSYEGSAVKEGTINLSDWLHLHDVIQALHRSGIHHCDLSLRNLTRHPDRSLNIIDFGLARIGPSCESVGCGDWEWLRRVHPSGYFVGPLPLSSRDFSSYDPTTILPSPSRYRVVVAVLLLGLSILIPYQCLGPFFKYLLKF
ncbi:hypothetical protein NLJ89_g6093 [Agrocybe chaxingu]|uniref:Protein kinase domain-containing protein n=1 Tax=Agrocybe chaxingu TaxID=84603 RepID=A0A9W8MWC3_9AGAR|nr:hypothetical protein NLJ89_g6093 [Agrocybe chaxingu]